MKTATEMAKELAIGYYGTLAKGPTSEYQASIEDFLAGYNYAIELLTKQSISKDMEYADFFAEWLKGCI